jgi:hypothetical protein
MMNDSEIGGEFRDGLFEECASTATYYENLIFNKDKKKSPIELRRHSNCGVAVVTKTTTTQLIAEKLQSFNSGKRFALKPNLELEKNLQTHTFPMQTRDTALYHQQRP